MLKFKLDQIEAKPNFKKKMLRTPKKDYLVNFSDNNSYGAGYLDPES